ncbi:hypothetical protein GGR50DRAFT_688475 [Xylaria sp. CBS 124048]|nr:hypothetical protein GGR50DRAFT_688475 [Xylaria sp. CBS 124048]
MPSYPGLGLSKQHHPQTWGEFFPTGHHEDCLGSISDLLQVRELAMMHIMDRLSDKVDWHKKVFDEKIVAKWREEALAYPDEDLWNLTITRSDPHVFPTPITGILTEKSFDYCIRELQGKARYFAATGIVPTLDATASVAKSDVLIQPALADILRAAFDRLKKDQADSPDWHPRTDEKVLNLVHPSMYPLVYKSTRLFQEEVVGVMDAIENMAGKGAVLRNHTNNDAESGVPSEFWSDNYQWLPSNLSLQDNGSVKFTSYINNLHPIKHPEIYDAIEKLVEKALPMWDQCLSLPTGPGQRQGAGRNTSRCPLPENPSDENWENWIPPSWKHLRANFNQYESVEGAEDDDSDEERLWRDWEAVRHPAVPEPKLFEEVDYSPPRRLAQDFKKTGLQIIVKMVSLELTPEKPSYPAGSWHVEGMMNEHICATALYYLDSDNITTGELSFRMQTNQDLADEDEYAVGQEQYKWLERVHGTSLAAFTGACLQSYGNVETRQGRFLAFPNVFQHRVSPFRLIDPTKPGYRRFIALWLVDPHIRIISTANVPPQQRHWWAGSKLGTSTDEEEAREHRLELMNERTRLDETANEAWTSLAYNFCEH